MLILKRFLMLLDTLNLSLSVVCMHFQLCAYNIGERCPTHHQFGVTSQVTVW